MTQKTILVTGAAHYWGDRVAHQLLQNDKYRVIGIDSEKPNPLDPKLHFFQTDLHAESLSNFLQTHQVSTVCHLDCPSTNHPNALHSALLGTANLLSACAKAGVARVIVKSSTAVYGAKANNPAFLPETHPLPAGLPSPTVNYFSQLESIFQRHQTQFNMPNLSILRFAHIVGKSANTPITRFLSQMLPKTVLGFNPIFQLIHEDDVTAALIHAIETDFTGIVNIAAENTLPLSRIIALTGKTNLPVPLSMAYLHTKVENGHAKFPIHPDYLRYRVVANLTRMTEDFGFTPAVSADDAVRNFAEQSYYRHLSPTDATRVKTVKRMWEKLKKES